MEFEEFLAARLPALLRFAAALTADAHRAEDIVQDVLVKAERRWRRISRMDAPEAYLKRMITNEYLSWRRRLSSRELVSPNQDLDQGSVADPAAAHADRDRRLPGSSRSQPSVSSLGGHGARCGS